MTEVVSVKFKSKGKTYFFDPAGNKVEKGQHVIVETMKGLEYAECVWGNHDVDDSAVIPPLRPVVRIATDEDNKKAAENKDKEAEAFEICRKKIEKHGLDMKLVDVEYSFDGNKILFSFTSDGRVDFRELVKDLASTFRMRIELRQIGVRDEARMLGGLGICGRPFCCAQFLDDFQPVSIKMAKTQGLSLNPTKISGTCGRLMCCLKYEQEAYEDLVKNMPKVDAFVDTPEGKGMVSDVNLLRGKIRVKLENHSELTIHTFDPDEITVLGGKAQRAEYLAAVAEGRIVEEPKKPKRREQAKVVQEPEQPLPEVHFKSEYLMEAVASETEEAAGQNQAKTESDKPRKDGRSRRRRGRGGRKHSEKDARRQEGGDSSQRTAPADKKSSGQKQGRGQQPQKAQQPQDSQQSQKGETSNDKPKQSRRRPYYRKKNSGKKPQNKQNNE